MVLRDLAGDLAKEPTLAGLLTLAEEQRTPSGAQLIGNAKTKFRDGFAGSGPVPDPEAWIVENDAPGEHLLLRGGDSYGAAYLRISMSPFLDNSQVRITSREKFRAPTRVGWGVSQNQRILGQEFFFGLAEADDTDSLGIKRTIPPAEDKPITSSMVVTSNVGAVTVPGHGLRTGDRVIIVGCADTRLNVGPVTVTVTGLNSLTVPITLSNATYTTTGGAVRVADPLSRVDNAGGLLCENTTTTNATLVTRRNGMKYRQRNSTINSTTQGVGSTAGWADSLLAGGNFELWFSLDEFGYRSWAADSNNILGGSDKFTQSFPDEELDYRLHVRARNLDYMSRPIARIISISKTGSNTATVVTDRPHDLTTAARIGITGVRDTTNFVQTTDMAVTGVVDATTFTVVFGTSVTSTSTDGGIIWVNHGLIQSPGVLGQTIQSVARDADGVVLVTGSASWSGQVSGELVHLWGLNTAATDAGFEGVYRVTASSGANMWLEPVGGYVTGAAIATINTGGSVIRRTEHRIHYVRVLDYTRILTEVVGGRASNTDGNNAVPMSITSAPTLTVSGTVAIGSPAIRGELTESTSTLGANALYSGSSRDTGTDATRRVTRIRVAIRHIAGLTPGSLYLEQSGDNTTWYESWRQPIPSDGYLHTFEVPVISRYYRWRFQNGAAAQTAMWFHTHYTLAEGPSTDLPKNLLFPLSITALAANATYSGPTLDLGGNHWWDEVRAAAFSDSSGTLYLEQSRDGTTWRRDASVALTGAAAPGGLASVNSKIFFRYVRATYVNGAVAQTFFGLDTSLLSR